MAEHDIDATDALLAALYEEAGEVPPSLADELAAFGEVRRAMAKLPEFEAPVALNASIMAAAARAVAAPARPSFFERVAAFFEPLVRRPALAALASLVLVASVGSLIYVQSDAAKKSELEEARAPLRTETMPPPETREEEGKLELREGSPTDDADGEEADDGARDRTAPSEIPASSPVIPERRRNGPGEPAPQVGVIVGGDIDLSAAKETKAAKSKPDEDTGTRNFGSGSGGSAEATTTKAPEPAPPPPEPKEILAELRAKARKHAKNRDCASVLKIGDTVKDLDAGYFDKTFRGDAALKSCYTVAK